MILENWAAFHATCLSNSDLDLSYLNFALPHSILRYLLVFIEVTLFSSFIWALVWWFKKTLTVKRWELYFIKISGVFFVVLHLAAALLNQLPATSIYWTGVILLIISGMLFFWALSVFDNPPAVAFANEIIVELNTKGPYQFIRHPFYTSYLLAWLGGSIASGMYLLVITFFIMLLVYYRAANAEENQWLNSRFSENYKNYRSKTGFFLPFL